MFLFSPVIMAPVSNPRIIYAEVVTNEKPIPGGHLVYDESKSIDIDSVPLNGGFLTKSLVLR